MVKLQKLPLFELPLVYQDGRGPGERYFCQAAPPERLPRAVQWPLPPEFRDSKVDAWTRRLLRKPAWRNGYA